MLTVKTLYAGSYDSLHLRLRYFLMVEFALAIKTLTGDITIQIHNPISAFCTSFSDC